MCFKPPDSFVKLIIYYGVSSIFSLCFIILIVENQYSFIAIYIYIDFISITVFRKKAIVGISFNPNFNDGKVMDAKSLLISGFTFTFPFLQINIKNEKLKTKTVKLNLINFKKYSADITTAKLELFITLYHPI